MKKLRVLFAALVLLGTLASPVLAAGKGQEFFRVQVKWSVFGQDGRHRTFRSIWSDPTRFIGTTTYLRWFTSSFDWEIGPDGFHSTFGADNSIYDARGFHVSLPGEGFVGTHWYQGQCAEGPEVTYQEDPNAKVIVVNTTGKILFVYYSDRNKPIELAPGETWSHPVKSAGSVNLQVVPDEMNWNTCADVVWSGF